SHGTLESSREWAKANDGYSQTRSRGHTMGIRTRERRRALRIERRRYFAHLVERCGCASEPDFPGPSRSYFRNALLAPGRTRPQGRKRGQLWRHSRRHGKVARGLSEVVDNDAARG